MMTPATILIDTTRCNGCEECIAACKKENGLGPDHPWRGQGAIDDLSASRFSTILRRPGGHFVRRMCRHCLEPACVSACIVGALQKTAEGPVIYNESRCMGCRYCMMACPYDIPRYDWDRPVPYIRKCTMCYHRLREGKKPACIDACPEEALLFGSRDELLIEAKKRLKNNPGYVQKVVGKSEIGGTAVLYISDIPLDFLGWKKDLGETPLPDLTWASLKKVPWTILGMGGLMTGVYWIIGRRMKMAAEASGEILSVSEPAPETNPPGEETAERLETTNRATGENEA